MSIVFHHAPMSSASPVAWALAELGVPHEKVLVDLKAGEQRRPEFLALNPNGKVPTLVVDGVPMFEALAIMMYLGERFGVEKGLWPGLDDPGRPQAMAWSAWAYVSVGTWLRTLFFSSGDRVDASFHNAAVAEHARKELGALLAILDQHLEGRAYVLGETFTIADVILAGTVGYARLTGVAVEPHARVAGWLARCLARPAQREAMGW
jgi:GST-like protein